METSKDMTPFNPEEYRSTRVDIVHPSSILRTIQGKKTTDNDLIKDAQLIYQRIEQLRHAGINILEIDGSLVFNPPEIPSMNVVVGGAFEGQCIEEYLKSAKSKGFDLPVDPLLTLRPY